MNLTQRLICYSIVLLLIPTLILLVYHEIPMDSLWWIMGGVGLFGGYEVIVAIKKKH